MWEKSTVTSNKRWQKTGEGGDIQVKTVGMQTHGKSEAAHV